jgi:hypothetical protein
LLFFGTGFVSYNKEKEKMWHSHKEPLKVGFFGYDRRDALVQSVNDIKGHQVIWVAHINQLRVVRDFLIDDPPDIFIIHPLARLNFQPLLPARAIMVIGPSRKDAP